MGIFKNKQVTRVLQALNPWLSFCFMILAGIVTKPLQTAHVLVYFIFNLTSQRC